MSLLNSLAKLYVRLIFRDGEYNSAKTQRDFNVPDPPRGLAKRCEIVDGPVRAYWIDKHKSDRGVLVYLHGGAFYFGPVKEHWAYAGHICSSTGMAGIVVDYALAPQRPFPAGLDEVVKLVAALTGRNWAFLGDSSGAALAVSACVRLREEGAELPQKLVLMSPWVDATLANPDIELTRKADVMMTVERLAAAAADYAGVADAHNPLISPMFADLTGLPPMLIQMGTADLLLADCRRFRDKCIAAGVAVKYEEYPDAFHDFMMLGALPEARRALFSQKQFLSS
jgi:epsilon-lactone hydrolase